VDDSPQSRSTTGDVSFLYDSNDRARQVDGINPAKPAGLYAKLVRRKVTVSLSLRPVSEAPFQFVCDVIEEESMYSWLS